MTGNRSQFQPIDSETDRTQRLVLGNPVTGMSVVGTVAQYEGQVTHYAPVPEYDLSICGPTKCYLCVFTERREGHPNLRSVLRHCLGYGGSLSNLSTGNFCLIHLCAKNYQDMIQARRRLISRFEQIGYLFDVSSTEPQTEILPSQEKYEILTLYV